MTYVEGPGRDPYVIICTDRQGSQIVAACRTRIGAWLWLLLAPEGSGRGTPAATYTMRRASDREAP